MKGFLRDILWRISKTLCGGDPTSERSNGNKEPSPSSSPASLREERCYSTVLAKRLFFPVRGEAGLGELDFPYVVFFYCAQHLSAEQCSSLTRCYPVQRES